MKPPRRPTDELRRLEALREFDLLDTLPEETLNDLTALAAHICEAPISLISLIDEQRQWFKANIGLSADEIPRDVSFCAHAILQPDVFIVPDATKDERFVSIPLVTGDPRIRFYAGAPLVTAQGHALGTLCVMDNVPRQLNPSQQEALRVLSRQVMAQLELRRQTRELARSERLLRTIFDSEPECVKVLGPDGSLRMMNRAGLAMLEADSFGQVADHCIYPLVAPEHRVKFEALTERVFRGESGTMEFQLVGLKGATRWLETHAAPLRDERGDVTALLGITRDITERRRAEEALRASEEKFQSLFESSPDAIIVATSAGIIHTINRQAERLFGYSRLELAGQWIENLMPARFRPGHVVQRENYVRDPHLRPMGEGRDLFARRKDGSEFPVVISLSPITTPEGLMVISTIRDITERKRAEAEARLLSQRLTLATDAASIGIWDWDLKADQWYASSTYFTMLGYDQDEGISDRNVWLQRLHPDEREAVGELIRTALAGSVAPYEYEARMRHADGTYRWINVIGRVIAVDEAGKASRLLGVRMDITERKRAEKRIQQLNRVYAVLSDINQTIVRETDVQTMLATACRIAVEKGQFRMAWIGLVDAAGGQTTLTAHAGATNDTLTFLSALPGDEQCGYDTAFTTLALQTGQHVVCNDIARDAAAAAWSEAALERGYRSMVSLPVKSAGQIVGTFNIYSSEPGFFDEEELVLLDELALDIGFALEVHDRETERRRMEHALRESEDRFRQLTENIQEVFWMTDPEKQQMLYISPAYEKIWGRTCASVYESSFAFVDTIHPDDRARISHATETRQLRGDYDETYRILRPDGTVRWIRDRALPVRDATGANLRIVGTAEDITDRRQLEEQFRQSQKMEAIGQLAGGVAHDFNNILAAIMMQADLAATEANLPEAARELLDDIKAATERAANLTRQLLAFSRRQVMQPRELDLNEIVASLTKMLQRILGEDVSLQLNLHPRALLTRADAGMLDQVLLNLVVNARDAMLGGGRLYIETTEMVLSEKEAASVPDASPGRHVCLRVTDTGSGIAPEHRARIFEPFFTTKEAGKGTGLGLATVFGIVKQHGGSLAVESEVGRGTTFQICLPATAEAATSLDEVAVNPKPRGGTETILLVEDEPAVRMLTRIVLERAGYLVWEARDGVEALRIWKEHQDTIQLVLTDIVMPEGVSGRELAARLQASKPELRVIFTSGYSADIAGHELSIQDAQNFIQKPSSPQRVLEIVRRCLDR